MQWNLKRGDRRVEATLMRQGEVQLDEGGETKSLSVQVIARDATSILLELDGVRHRLRYARSGGDVFLHLDGIVTQVHRVDVDEEDSSTSVDIPRVWAPMPGRVLEVLVAEGDTVVAGQTLLRLEAMKMEVDLDAGMDGRVGTLHVAAEDLVDPEQVLVTLVPHVRVGDEG